jgi:hypothetical protein
LSIVAHGIGGVRDLPVPTWLFLWAGAVVLIVSFVALGAFWSRPLLARHARGAALGAALSRVVLGPVRIGVQIVSVALFALVWATALVGDTDPLQNFAPTWIYVMFWLGVPALTVVLGNVWRALSPWRALADAFVWGWERSGRLASPLAVYPERLGRWPGAVALFAFAALELTYSDPSSPRALAFAIAIYTYVTLFGMASFGRVGWTERGEAFAILFAYLARAAPLHVEERRIRLRWPLTGLSGAERVPGSLAFVAVMLGSVAFDGYSRTGAWQDLVARAQGPYVVDSPGVAELVGTGLAVWGLLMAVVLVVLGFGAACAIAGWMVDTPRPLQPEFLLSLVPIAFVYELAHYFSLFLIQGQFTIQLLSDPFGRGWDLFGTADFVPNLTIVAPNTVWYVQVTTLVAGHVAALAVAHDRAVDVFPERRDALRSQYAMLGLMVLYTVGGMWILSRR